MNKTYNNPLSLALSGALVGGLALSGSVFAMQALPQGYALAAAMQAEPAADKAVEGKCGEGKCGEAMKNTKAAHADHADHAAHAEGKCGEGKCGEGKCGGMKHAATDTDGKPAAAAKDKAAHAEGKCGEGKCGEGKCGGMR